MKDPAFPTRKQLVMTVPLARVVTVSLMVGAYSVLALLKSRPPFAFVPDIPIGVDAALSAAMALLISFRVNRAYERWWEARTLWGTLVNVSRNLAIKLRRLRHPSEEERQAARDLIVAFSIGLKDHLRGDAQLAQLPGFENDRAEPTHVPVYIVSRLYSLLQQWRSADDAVGSVELLVFDAEARVFMDVCGGCEKIRTTPVSRSWKTFTLQCITIYLLAFPWAFVDDFGYWTTPVAIVVAYIVVAAEMIARYVEEPFGLHEDHLDLDSITNAIDRSVSEALLSED